MLHTKLREATQRVAQQSHHQDIGLEGFESVTEFFRSVKDFFISPEGAIVTPMRGMLYEYSDMRTIKKLHSAPAAAVGAVLIYVPVGFTGQLMEYAKYQLNAINKYSDVVKRIYQPTLAYFEKAISDYRKSPALINEDHIFVKGQVTAVPSYDADIKQYRAFFKTGVNKTNAGGKAEFKSVYPSTMDFENTYKLIRQTEKIASALHLDRIKEAEDKLYEAINTYIKLNIHLPIDAKQSKENHKGVIEAVSCAVKETELLASLLYGYNSTYTSVLESVNILGKVV